MAWLALVAIAVAVAVALSAGRVTVATAFNEVGARALGNRVAVAVLARGIGVHQVRVRVEGDDRDLWGTRPLVLQCVWRVDLWLDRDLAPADAAALTAGLSGAGEVHVDGNRVEVEHAVVRVPVSGDHYRDLPDNTHDVLPDGPVPFPLADPRCRTNVIHNGA